LGHTSVLRHGVVQAYPLRSSLEKDAAAQLSVPDGATTDFRVIDPTNLDREAQAARTGVLRVRVRDLELAAEQVFLPFELRPLEIRQALRVDEHAHVLLGYDDVRGPRGLREVHPVLHPAAPAGDDSQTEGGRRLALFLAQHANPSDCAVRDRQRKGLGCHHKNRVPIRSNAGPRLTSCAATRAVGGEITSFASATTTGICRNVIVSNPLLENGRPDPWF